MHRSLPIKFISNWLLYLSIALALVAIATLAYAEKTFDANVANQTLDKLTITLSTSQLKANDLENAIDILLGLQNKAKICVNDTQNELAAIKPLLPETSQIAENIKLTPDQQFLYSKQKRAKDKLTACKLFILRSQDAISAFSKTAQELTASKILTRVPTVSTEILTTPSIIINTFKKYDISILINQLNLNQLTVNHYLFLSILVLFGLSATYYINLKLKKILKTCRHDNMPDQIFEASLCVYKQYSSWLNCSLILCLYFTIIKILNETNNNLVIISLTLVFYISYIMMIKFCFKPPAPAIAFCDISEKVAIRLIAKLKLLLNITVGGFLIYLIFKDQEIPEIIVNISRDILITLIAISLFGILFLINKAPKFLHNRKGLRSSFSLMLGVLLTTIVIAQWMGYHILSLYLLEAITLTILSTFISWLLNYITQAILNSFSDNKYQWQNTLHYFLGIQRNDTIPEIMGLKAAAFITIFTSYLITLYNIWDFTSPWGRNITDVLSHEVTVSTITFIPSRIILGFVVFSILCLITRIIRNIIKLRPTPPNRKAAQEAMAAISGYIGFFLAVLLGLIIGGVNVAGLALVAGALSVGIGFGLQGIVSNFLAGLILLLERPIKPGDRIHIGTEEGFVKKISIRSTRITTLEQVDIIIPNAELISKNVINYTFNNYKWRVTLKVGVAYGTDVELVKKCLTDIACNHPEVLNEGTDKPQVFFFEFSDSSLQFEVWCIIKDVNKKNIVLNELNSEVSKKFEEMGINIPFPQRDIHIKEPIKPLTNPYSKSGSDNND